MTHFLTWKFFFQALVALFFKKASLGNGIQTACLSVSEREVNSMTSRCSERENKTLWRSTEKGEGSFPPSLEVRVPCSSNLVGRKRGAEMRSSSPWVPGTPESVLGAGDLGRANSDSSPRINALGMQQKLPTGSWASEIALLLKRCFSSLEAHSNHLGELLTVSMPRRHPRTI